MAKEKGEGARYGEATQDERRASGYRFPDSFDKAPAPLGTTNEAAPPAQAKSITPVTENKAAVPVTETKAPVAQPARKSVAKKAPARKGKGK